MCNEYIHSQALNKTIFLEKPGALTLKLLSTSSVIIKIDSKDNVEWDCHKRNSFRRTKLITSGVKHLVVTTCAQVYLLPWCDKHSGWDRNKNPCKIVWKPIHLCCSCFLVILVDQSKLKHMNLAFFKAGKASKRGQQTQNCRKQILRSVKNIEGTEQTSTLVSDTLPCAVPLRQHFPFSLLWLRTTPTPIQYSCLTRVYHILLSYSFVCG